MKDLSSSADMTTEVARLEDEATDIWLVGLVGLVGRKGLVV